MSTSLDSTDSVAEVETSEVAGCPCDALGHGSGTDDSSQSGDRDREVLPEETTPTIEAHEIPDLSSKKVRIAVAGCAHGEMDKIYAALKEIETDKGYTFDLLICCGDYQSVRNYGDLAHMHVPDKYKSLQTFYKYYSGEVTAPILTLFVGGNHEASGYLSELPNGGWVAPRIYYMGFANVIRFAGLRIAGLSGIFNGRDFNKGHFERPPYGDHSNVVSAYHVRNLDVWRLKQLRSSDDDKLSNPIDIVVTHDWPSGITDFGDKERLLKIKPYFKDDIDSGKLGNSATMRLLYEIRPRYWLSAHLHVMFAALVPHKATDEGSRPEPTRFLALDKPIPHRHFIHAIELNVAADAEMTFSYDAKWLAILKSTDKFTSVSHQSMHLPSAHSDERHDFRPTDEEMAAVEQLGDLTIPTRFRQTAPPIKGAPGPFDRNATSLYYRNPQSTEFCSWLGISDMNQMLADLTDNGMGMPHYVTEGAVSADAAELRRGDGAFGDDDFMVDTRPTAADDGDGDSLTTPVESEEMDAEPAAPAFLEDFAAPKWKGASSSCDEKKDGDNETDEGGERSLKRRKVDIAEDE